MSDNNAESTPESTVPQAVTDELAALAGVMKAAEQKAVAAWKTAAIVWVVFLAVVFGYLYIFAYRGVFKPFLEPRNLIGWGKTVANEALAAKGYSDIGSTRLVDQIVGKIEEEAPGLVQDYVKPQIDAFLEDLPRRRSELVKLIAERAPEYVDQGLVRLKDDILPRGRQMLLDRLDEQIDLLMEQVDEELGGVVDEILVQIQGDVEGLQGADLRRLMQEAFEEAMGPILDKILIGLDERVREIKVQLGEVAEAQRTGTATYRQKLEFRLVQLILALFEGVDTSAGGISLDDIAAAFKGKGIELSKPAQEQVRDALYGPGPSVQDADLSHVPEEAREEILRNIEAAQQSEGRRGATEMPDEAVEAMREGLRQRDIARAQGLGAAGGTAAPAGAAGRPAMGETQRQREAIRRASEANMPEEVRKEREEALKAAAEAQQDAQDAQGAGDGQAVPDEARKRLEEGRKAQEAADAAHAD